MIKPIISVIMPMYNAERYVEESIKSVLDQSFMNFELIIVNDCSTDNSIQKIFSFNDSRIILVHNKKNLGISKSLNKAIDISRGEYIARIDADDLMKKTRLENQYKFLEKFTDIGVVGSAIEVIGDFGKYCHRYPKEDRYIKYSMFFENSFAHPSIMCRKKLLIKAGRYTNNFSYVEDWDLWFRLSKLTKFHNLQKPLTIYRAHNDSSCYKYTKIQSCSKISLLKNIFYENKLPFKSYIYNKNFIFSYKNLILLYAWLTDFKNSIKADKYDLIIFHKILYRQYLYYLSKVNQDFVKVISFYFKNPYKYDSLFCKIPIIIYLIFRYRVNKKRLLQSK